MSDEETPSADDVAKLASLLDSRDDTNEIPPSKPSAQAEGDEIAPEEPASDDDDAEESEPEAEEAPAIDPPASYDAKARAEFAKLPPEMQQIVADRESSREKAINKRLSEIADERKAAEADRQAIAQQRQQYSQSLLQHEAVLRAQMMGEFSDLKSQADVSKLSAEDPARWIRYQSRLNELREVAGQQHAIAEQEKQEGAEKARKYEAEQRQIIAEKAPGFLDGPKAEKTMAKLRAYVKELGATDEQVSSIKDAWIGLALKDALEGREMKAKAASAMEKKVVTAPKVASPGTSEDDDGRKNKAAIRKLARHGRTDDQVAYLAKLLG